MVINCSSRYIFWNVTMLYFNIVLHFYWRVERNWSIYTGTTVIVKVRLCISNYIQGYICLGVKYLSGLNKLNVNFLLHKCIYCWNASVCIFYSYPVPWASNGATCRPIFWHKWNNKIWLCGLIQMSLWNIDWRFRHHLHWRWHMECSSSSVWR